MMLRFLGAAAGASRPWARRPRGPAALARFGSSNSASSSSPNDDQVVTPCDAGLHNPPVKLHVVGSSAMGPSLRRSSNSQALRIWNDVWLFDCGEGTQRQLMSSNEVTISHVRKIFITHMHGDHVMGLPGLLTSLFGHWSSAEEYVEVFGPPGLRRFLHDCFASTYAFTTVNFVVHELWGWDPHDLPTGLTRFGGVDRPPVGTEVGLSPGWWPPPLSDEQRARVLERERHEQQRARDLGQLPSTEGLNIFPTRVASPLAPSERQHHHLRGRGRRGAGCGGGGGGGGGRRSRAQDYYWELPFSDDSPAAQKFRVVAAPLVHTVPCVGYVVTEADTPGKVRMTPELRARLEDPRNVEFCRARGMDTPFMALRLVRQGETLELADGMLRPEDVLYPPTQGRRIAILGDTSNASAAARHCVGADLLVHEATKSPDHFAPSPDQRLSEKARRRFRRNEAQTRKRNFQSGHSSPDVAGRFATDVGAEALLLNHFSQSQGHNQGVLDVVRSYAKRAFAGRLRLAADFMTIDVPVRTTTADRSEAAAEAAQAQAEASFSTDRYQPWFPHSFHDRVEGKQVVPIPQGSAAAAAAAVEGSRGPNGDGPARRVRRPLQRFLKQDRKGTKQPAQGRAQVLLNRQQQRERQQAKRQAEAAAAATGSER